LGLMHRAVAGRYQGRTVRIEYSEVRTLEALEAGAVSSAKFVIELALYSIPYVGPLVMVGQALAGKTIWGDRLSIEGRVVVGLCALIPIAHRMMTAESSAAAELAAKSGTSQAEAQALLRGARNLTTEERSFLQAADAKIRQGAALNEAEARQLASIVNRIGARAQLIFSAANDINLIWKSQRYWGLTEGSVYGARIPVDTFWQRLRAMVSRKEGMVIFQGEAAKLFHAHEVEGAYSAMKRLLGQHKAGFGDIVFDAAIKEGDTIIVTRAHIATAAEVQHAGQSTAWAMGRLWGRRLVIEPLAVAGAASGLVLLYAAFNWVRAQYEQE
jgi:hypothetical protein